MVNGNEYLQESPHPFQIFQTHTYTQTDMNV